MAHYTTATLEDIGRADCGCFDYKFNGCNVDNGTSLKLSDDDVEKLAAGETITTWISMEEICAVNTSGDKEALKRALVNERITELRDMVGLGESEITAILAEIQWNDFANIMI